MKVAYYNPDMISPRWSWLFCKYLPQVTFLDSICDETVDFVYCGSLQCLAAGVGAAEKYNKPLVCWVWDIPNIIEIFPNKKEYVVRAITQLKQAAIVLSASKNTQWALETYGIESKQLYFYVDTEAISKIPRVKKQDTIIQVGRIVPQKQCEVAIAAAGLLQLPIHIFGPSNGTGYTTYLNSVAKKFKTTIQIHINKTQIEVLTAIKQAKVLVQPTVFEGWGMPPIEAILLGTPPIVSNLPVFREQYGEKIVYHKVGDADDLQEKIKYLMGIDNKDYLQNLKEAVNEYTPEKFAQRWMKVIMESTQ